jgi:hypothetical protein
MADVPSGLRQRSRNKPPFPLRTLAIRVVALGSLANPIFAQNQESTEDRIKKLEAEFESYKNKSEKERAEMKSQIDALKQQLEKSQSAPSTRELDDAIAELQLKVGAMQQSQSALQAARGQRVAYLDLSFDLLTAVGGSQATDAQLKIVQPGGHDPKQRGFTLQNAELFMEGAVDPNFKGATNIVLQIDDQGATTIELEEAYLVTTNLPENLQLKVGQYFTEFGRINKQHPHEWAFADETLIVNRMFGADGLRAPGARLSWLAPTDFYMELIGGVQNAHGETQTSFFGTADTAPPIKASSGALVPGALGGHPFVRQDVRNLGDLLYTTRAVTSFDLSDESTIVPGASAAFGPNATGTQGNTQIYGLDAFYKWKPVANDQGWPFVQLQGEYMWRRYYAAAFTGDLDQNGINETFPNQTFRDDGFYAQALWGFARPWVGAVRVDYVNGNGASTGGDGAIDREVRLTGDLTYYPSEFSKIRLQADLGKFGELNDRTFLSVWLQFEILFGAHGAHKF